MENVLDSVVEALRRDPNRKFVFAEMVIKLNSLDSLFCSGERGIIGIQTIVVLHIFFFLNCHVWMG